MAVFPSSPAVPTDPVWRLSVEQYHQMIQMGILTEDDPIELLEGWLITKMSKNRPHSLATQLTREALARVVPADWYVDAQEPITTGDSEPEPDVTVIKGSRRDYTDRHPYPEEVGLVVEVSDATLQRDRVLKLRVYANARIAIYWILNLPDQQLEVYSDPTGSDEQAAYRKRKIYSAADEVPVIIDGQELARLKVSELLS